MLTIRLLQQPDIAPIAAAFVQLGWNKPASLYEKYLSEQDSGQRVVLVAFVPVVRRTMLSGTDTNENQARLTEHHPAERYDAPAGEEFAGYVTICWKSHYRPFRQAHIPEIVDFNVLPQFRRRKIGSRLLDEAERRIAEVHPVAGIGVGMTADYGAAQRMYVLRGYVPDGHGLMYEGHPAKYGKQITVDDDLALYFTKTLR